MSVIVPKLLDREHLGAHATAEGLRDDLLRWLCVGSEERNAPEQRGCPPGATRQLRMPCRGNLGCMEESLYPALLLPGASLLVGGEAGSFFFFCL